MPNAQCPIIYFYFVENKFSFRVRQRYKLITTVRKQAKASD
ncbi:MULTISPECIES: hypothetical protein [Calothrix]|nr:MULTISPECIES: hypothetical protein [Calothrix]